MDEIDPVRTAQEPRLLDTRPILEAGGSPCTAVDDAVRQLAPGQALVLLVPFEPVPLYAKLGHLGFSPEPEQLPDGTWRVLFRPETEAPRPEKVPACACSCSL
jgi:hypothetical protein